MTRKPKPNGPRCPMCGRPLIPINADYFRCKVCPGHFDGKPDEGGPISNDPVRCAIANENRRGRR